MITNNLIHIKVHSKLKVALSYNSSTVCHITVTNEQNNMLLQYLVVLYIFAKYPIFLSTLTVYNVTYYKSNIIERFYNVPSLSEVLFLP